MLINYKNTREEIVFQISDDLFHFKVNGLYQPDEVEKLRCVLFAAKENFKHYAVKEHATVNQQQYDNLLKELIILAENRRDCTQLEKYGTMVGGYALISFVESPLYYHENINLIDFTHEKLMTLADTIYHTPTAYLSVVCPVLTLPEVYEEMRFMAQVNGTSVLHEMRQFAYQLVQYIHQYQQVDLKQADQQTIKRNKQVHSLLNITSECEDAFYCSENIKELRQNTKEDYIQSLHLVNGLLKNQFKNTNISKTLVKK